MRQIPCILYATAAYGLHTNRSNWESGKDFFSKETRYFSIRDVATLKEWGYTGIVFVSWTGQPMFEVSL